MTPFRMLRLYRSLRIARELFLEQLTQLGYERVDQVSEAGDFSVKGEIVEIYPVSFEEPIRVVFDADRIESIRAFQLADRSLLEEHPFVVLLRTGEGERSLAHDRHFPLQSFVDLEAGDIAVHIDHGIGRYHGIRKLKTDKGLQDFLVLEYEGGDKLYVPTEELHLVQKYIAFTARPPRLHRLGTKVWERAKIHAARGVYSYALELLELQARRSQKKGHAFSKDVDWQLALEAAFPYRETPDQAQATQDVKRDMESPRPMDRLLCGDVGYGKTEVALRAAFKAVMDDRQVAILVPTTILAEQHLKTFRERFQRYPVCVEMLSRFKTPQEVEEILKGLWEGRVDVVIGTHMLLSKRVQFRDLGLVIIDEEQRFGVRHKERLKRFRLEVDVLTLTATPIPRTLYLSLMGTRDFSLIMTAPKDRLPIRTRVTEYNEGLIRRAVLLELRRGGQIYFVSHRVKGLEKIRESLAKLLPEARLAVCHGQMPERKLEEVMLQFISHRIDLLVSTTIIESGIDIPNVNTLFVNRADLFGLADLYQLRGRIGRFTREAFAYFFVPGGERVTEEGRTRLLALEQFTELGAGFKIAMRDLEMRGAGNILGTQQHGHVQAVGFDLYLRLLRETVERLQKGKPISYTLQ